MRAEIDAKIRRCAAVGVGPSDRVLLERLIDELEAQARAESKGKEWPSKLVLPREPVPPRPPPPVPELPKSERYRLVGAGFDRQIELLDTVLKVRDLPKGHRKQRKRQRDLLASQRAETLNRVLREESPVDLLRRHDEAEAAHRAHEEAARSTLESWKRDCQQQKERWERGFQQLKDNPKNGGDYIHYRAVQRLRRDLEDLLKGRLAGPPIEKVPWRLLPPPEAGEAGLEKMLTDIRSLLPGVRLEGARLEFAYDLGPVRIYVGLGEFEGYLAFLFERTDHVLLECPMGGNAAYIFREDWRILSRLSKTELLNYHTSEVDRVIHDPDGHWRFRVRSRLGL